MHLTTYVDSRLFRLILSHAIRNLHDDTSQSALYGPKSSAGKHYEHRETAESSWHPSFSSCTTGPQFFAEPQCLTVKCKWCSIGTTSNTVKMAATATIPSPDVISPRQTEDSGRQPLSHSESPIFFRTVWRSMLWKAQQTRPCRST